MIAFVKNRVVDVHVVVMKQHRLTIATDMTAIGLHAPSEWLPAADFKRDDEEFRSAVLARERKKECPRATGWGRGAFPDDQGILIVAVEGVRRVKLGPQLEDS